MSSHETTKRLNAYVDGALSPVAAWRVRRHLHGCPTCAAEVAALHRLTTEARGLYTDEPVPDSLLSSIAPIPKPSPRLRVVALAAVSLIVVGGAVRLIHYVNPGASNYSGIAFAEVEQAMAEIRNARWQETKYEYDKDGRLTSRKQCEVTARTESPTILYRVLPGGYQAPGAMEGPNVILQSPERMVIQVGNKNQYAVLQMPGDPRTKEQRAIPIRMIVRNLTIGPGPDQKKEQWEKVLGWRKEDRPHWTGHTVTIGGKPLAEFYTKSTDDDGEVMEYTVHADPISRRIVSAEAKLIYSNGKLRQRLIREGYRYDLPLAEAAFRFQPPPGAKVTTSVQQPPPPDIWNSLTDKEKQQIQEIATQFLTTYTHDDFAAFSRLWDFEYLDRFTDKFQVGSEQKREWTARFQKHRLHPSSNLPNLRELRILRVNTTRSILGRGKTEKRVPDSEPELLEAQAMAPSATKQQGKKRPFYQSYLLRRAEGGTFRIVRCIGYMGEER